jgi:hypothetical protein
MRGGRICGFSFLSSPLRWTGKGDTGATPDDAHQVPHGETRNSLYGKNFIARTSG